MPPTAPTVAVLDVRDSLRTARTLDAVRHVYANPSPASDDPRVVAIAEAARELVEKRDRWLNPEGASEADLKKRTLTNLYNQRPTWLALAHGKLDAAVGAAYGWPEALGDDEVLERLLALNGVRAGGSQTTRP